MIRFVTLFHELDATTRTGEKVEAMCRYFSASDPEDAAWATWFLSGNRLRRLVSHSRLRQWAAEEAGIPSWLFEESYHVVGDLAETFSLIVPAGQNSGEGSLADWVVNRLKPLRDLEEQVQREAVVKLWRETTADVRFVLMKLITGAFRVGVSRKLVTRAVAKTAGLSPDVIAHRMMGSWEPTAEFYLRLIDPEVQEALPSQPYPFCLAHPIDVAPGVDSTGPEAIGSSADYLAEWKWDGIRGQLIRRSGQTYIWSRGEELMERRWPEVESGAEQLPEGTVLDGEILAARADGTVLPFAQLQRRIGRKKVGKKLLAEVPVVFHAFDLIEHNGDDIRTLPLADRRGRLERLMAGVNHPHLRPTRLIDGDSWQAWQDVRRGSRDANAEGLMIKRLQSPYDVGRARGSWWKWKVDPYTIDAVLIYAQKGHGRRSGLYTDYTFAVWDGGDLVPIAKAYSGLNNREIREVDRFIRQHTRESFGPVRSVEPQLVMELAFEGLQRSRRHKSGVATRFPRIVRWRNDKRPADANTLDELLELLPLESSAKEC